MGFARNIWVRDRDAQLWERAEAYAEARRLTMSALLMTALEQYLEAQGEE